MLLKINGSLRFYPRYLYSRILSIASFLTISQIAYAQNYPQSYFRNPLSIPIFLAGNFGECRPGHFHSGIDIKTLGKENQPVYAAADGYISRIKMEPGGFGHALYITHSNGYTTLYAHLNLLAEPYQSFVREQQYKNKSWTIDQPLAAIFYPVKKGQLIAYSGNTGGSTAPHLHFEIRETKTEHPLNPLLFGLPVKDNLPPVIKSIALYNRSKSIFYDTPVFLSIPKTAIQVPTNLGIGIKVVDIMNGADNPLAPYKISWFLDDALQGTITLDDIGYDESRYVNAYADYMRQEEGKGWYQCLFQLPGNKLYHIYSNLNAEHGIMIIPADGIHKITIDVEDAFGNKATSEFSVRNNKIPSVIQGQTFYSKEISYKGDNFRFSMPKDEFYDSYNPISSAEKSNKFSDVVIIGNPHVPLHKSYLLSIQPSSIVNKGLLNKIILYNQEDETGVKATADQDGYYTAKTRSFGHFWLAIDTIPPSIKLIAKPTPTSKRILFKVSDVLTSVARFSGTLEDGTWLCFEQHGDNYFYTLDAYCPKGTHTLTFTAEDENANLASYKLIFTK